MRILVINSCLEILVWFFVLVGYASVDLVPCDKSRRIFTDSWGVITDGPIGSNYTQDSHCEWLIKANNTNQFITLKFRSMGTECSYDYVFVYDGDSFGSTLLGSFSGKTEPQQVTATSGHMLILLYSDTNYVLDGFRAEFSITDCPNNCSDHGVCYNHQCVCGSDWGGFDCSRHLCPEKCGRKFGRGHCEQEQGCICRTGYLGQACSLYEYDNIGNKWHWLSHSESGLQPRAAHTAVYVNLTDSLYVFGGYNLSVIFSSMAVYNFKNNTWKDDNGNLLPIKKLYNELEPSSVAALIEQAGSDWEHKWGINSGTSFLRNLLYTVRQNSTSTSRRRQRHSHSIEDHKPIARYGHAACRIGNGFVMYGGKLQNGSLSNELWFYNVFIKKWELRGRFSKIKPPPLTRHTLTVGNETIYLFGGSMENGEFSPKLFSIVLKPNNDEEWTEIKPRGGKELDIRVVAHTTNYHQSTNSLIVYGGILAGVSRFSKLSDRMFIFQLDNKYWTEIHYTREHLREKFVPRERAFHSANILGNYLIIFGGYSHRHNKEEICYDNQMYLYHLGCHTWVNPEILGNTNDSRYPKHQGVFAHASAVRNGNTLLLVGGYHGNVNGDLLAYTVPPMIATRSGLNYDPEATCSTHRNYVSCSADPECGWCSADEICYGRTIGANCTTNLQTTRCPGICPALGDCHSCLIHGGVSANKGMISASQKLRLGECTWCVQNARCHHKDNNYGICGSREDSPSMIPGWWGVKGTEVLKPEQCRELDQRPGFTFIKYYHPVNYSQPDHVAIINATTVDFNSPSNPFLRIDPTTGGEMVAKLLGFLRLPDDWQEILNICISYCTATLKIADIQLTNLTAEQAHCKHLKWPASITDNKVKIDFETHKIVNLGAYNTHQQSQMALGHFGNYGDNPKVFTFEYLEPYANGSCSEYTNCLHCLTDSKCGWCDASNTCLPRSEDESKTCIFEDNWRYLTLSPSSCSNCSNFISCESCTSSGICEWWLEEAKCARIGQRPDAAVSSKYCPIPCYKRQDCTSCLDQKGRCVWCEATQQCFSFSVYTSEYQFGMCREWLDQPFPLITAQDNSMLMNGKGQEKCKSCSLLNNCSTCLGSLSCGWCYNASNPMTGMCVQGDFNKPYVNCSEVLKQENAKWAYAQCPDVDECGLGLHDCHTHATCTNTDGSFSCQCQKGYIGDGRTSCVRTCYNVCVHGQCEGEPDYACRCNLGWFGDDCSQNCGCNNHSTCPEGKGICDKCLQWTMGEFCQYCRPGSFGNATTELGCQPCECNGHGISDLGECNSSTGICYCKDNTEGPNCEKCAPNYYGDPRVGNKCYYQCESRGLLTGTEGQGISSMQAFKAPYGGAPTRECLWIIHPNVKEGTPIIQLQVNSSQLNVTCGENAVYVYDGMPEPDTGSPSQSLLLGVFCSEEAIPTATVESRTGLITVHYKQGLLGEGFSALYKVFDCNDCRPPRMCKNNLCVCEDNFVGYYCEESLCSRNCSYFKNQGECDRSYGRCICKQGWVGPSCDIKATGTQILFTELFNTKRLADHLEHLRKTLPRFGHSLTSDRRGSIWMFGGYSLSHGPLNDIRLFDTRNSTWTQVTVESTPDAKMPLGRYFHGADIVHSRQSIYLYGGLTRQSKGSINRTLSDLWTFDIPNQRWGEIKRIQEWPPALAGHTLTSYRNSTIESLILIGGVSGQNGFLNSVWEFFVEKESWQKWHTKGYGPKGIYGHTTVFHQQTNSFYVFGGNIYDKQEYLLSNNLYMLEYHTKTWKELNSLGSSPYFPKPRFMHSAITTSSYLLVMGGKTHHWNITDTLYAYSYNCNQWFNLMSESLEKVGPLPLHTYAQAMAIEPDGDAAYIIGGWGADSQSTVLRLELPEDICVLWTSKHNCLRVAGCAYCAIKKGEEIVQEVCHSNQRECPFGNIQSNSSIISNQGKLCKDPIAGIHNCSALQDCTLCLQSQECHWCDDTCSNNKTCDVTSTSKCPLTRCSATDCVQCHQLPGCDWNYAKKDCVPLLREQVANDIKTCAPPCVKYTTCSSCLDAADCRWSTQLDECLSASYQPMYCAGGVCGLVLQMEDKEYCPEPCSSFNQCSQCLKHAYCGWCAASGLSGDGICTEGSGDKPMNGTCDEIYKESKIGVLNETELETNITYSWHYVKCPPENECANGHHNCAPESEICQDLEIGYECVCGYGYKAGPTGCEPVCSAGCVRGQCVEPNKCLCDFGYVGANCSIQCQCNGHANCEGPDKLDKCLKCHNNTMGDQCEKCEPLFVGDPSDGGICIPCLDYCHGHSSICVANTTNIDISDGMDQEYLKEILKEGPKSYAKCLRCSNLTSGTTCDECIDGNFRGTEDHRDPCRACDCHGHGDTCDPITGDKCNCKNNTESDVCGAGPVKNSARPCWMVQCSKCKEGYFGTPTSGHQCYKQMSVDSKMCFDAKPIDECKIKPKPLHPGDMVFFVIQPRFMNVDIRIIIDVTQGRLNVFMSTHDDTYVAYPNFTSGLNDINLDLTYGLWDNGTQKTKDVFLEKEAQGLRTYITITQPKTILTVKDLKDRLVITLPEEYHSLETTRFFLVLQALDSSENDKKVSYGIVFSRQDQLHIDLFVFFSVFFSCFFLFLSSCVVAWKAKQAADIRRARRRHVVEMLHMAKRPFATVTLNLSGKIKTRRSIHHDLKPVAVEPTDDGLAAVATVFVSLPGGSTTPVKLALASSLILLSRQYPMGGRTFLRRRSTHAAAPT